MVETNQIFKNLKVLWTIQLNTDYIYFWILHWLTTLSNFCQSLGDSKVEDPKEWYAIYKWTKKKVLHL